MVETGLTLGTLNPYLKRRREDAGNGTAHGELIAVEVAGRKWGADSEAGCGLAVVLSHGRRIEVGARFDGPTLQRLIQVLENI